jgi:tRNA (cmo5U34)-methyltransferase
MSLFARHPNKFAVCFGIDSSEDMIKAAERNIKGLGAGDKCKFLKSSILTYPSCEADIVVSLFTFQFLSDWEKHEMMRNIYDKLVDGGIFILADKMMNSSGTIANMNRSLYEDFKAENLFTLEEIKFKERSLRGVQRPISIGEYQTLAHEIGFKTFNIFIKYLDFAGILMIK